MDGGKGLAKGFGGPVAPADWIVDVEGLGGGRVIIPIVLLGPPEWLLSVPAFGLLGLLELVPCALFRIPRFENHYPRARLVFVP